jgi:hypothetical protein
MRPSSLYLAPSIDSSNFALMSQNLPDQEGEKLRELPPGLCNLDEGSL